MVAAVAKTEPKRLDGAPSLFGDPGVVAQDIRCAPIRVSMGQLRTFIVLFVRVVFCA